MSSVTYINILFLIFVLTFCHAKSAESDDCKVIQASLVAKRTRQKAWDKCVEYQERFVYPCKESSVPGVSPTLENYCNNGSTVQNDSDDRDNEFNYVVSFLYDVKPGIRWLSGGTIISERHILTVAVGMFSAMGQPHSVYLGGPVEKDLIDNSRLYKIKRVIPSPEYNKNTRPFHIAIVETKEPMKLNKYVRPACLHTGEPLNYDEATLISRDFVKNVSQAHVTKLELTKLSDAACTKLLNNVLPDDANTWLMCYEDKKYTKERFQHNSGCPLQVKSDQIHCMNLVIGVSSLANLNEPSWSIFTRVSPYLAWIESVVWP